VNRRMNANILKESQKHHDIIQEDFIDAYRNLSYKGVMGLKWATSFCENVTFILNIDDDVFLNLPNVVEVIQNMQLRGIQQNLLLCNLMSNTPPIRDPTGELSKWYVSRKEFKPDIYPDYCSGMFILYSKDVAASIYKASLDEPFFWVDDVYITGILAAKAGIDHTVPNKTIGMENYDFNLDKSDMNKFLSVANVNDMYAYWGKFKKQFYSNVKIKGKMLF
ncbi:unnamed protein product, partial [Owenia fusiformis]